MVITIFRNGDLKIIDECIDFLRNIENKNNEKTLNLQKTVGKNANIK